MMKMNNDYKEKQQKKTNIRSDTKKPNNIKNTIATQKKKTQAKTKMKTKMIKETQNYFRCYKIYIQT